MIIFIKHAVGLKQDREEALNRVVVHMWSAAAMELLLLLVFLGEKRPMDIGDDPGGGSGRGGRQFRLDCRW